MKKTTLFNRELSWIEFNARVLHEATRKDLPILERLNFLGITSSNFDEFFQVRVAAIKAAQRKAPHQADYSGLTPAVLLKKISDRCHQLLKIQNETLVNDVLPSLSKIGINYVKPENFTQSQKSFTESLFHHEIYPLLTPLRTDGMQFPRIGNLKLNAAFLLEKMSGFNQNKNPFATEQEEIISIVQIPASIPRIVWLPTTSESIKQFTVVDDIVLLYGKELFPGYNVKESMLFKVCRDADVAVNEDSGESFIQNMQQIVEQRQFSPVIKFTCNSSNETFLNFFKDKLEITDDDIYKLNGLFDSSSLQDLRKTDIPADSVYPEWKHFNSTDLPENETYWNTLRQKDVLLHVPYQSFDPIVKFINDAAHDQNVLAIKMTLYRPGRSNPIVNALIEAAHSGKQVTAFVELKARFDEESNISWANELEKAGVIVVYGIVNLKVHAKACLVVRKESDGIRRYVHLSTGNYNPSTAKVYQDFSLFSSNPELANDATLFFNVISGYSAVQKMQRINMAPIDLKSRLIEMIDREIQVSTKDNPGLIVAKMNSLCHKEIIEKLYEASNAGVQIMLNVRGICTLIPGAKNLSENIQVVSVIDRYLEHSRVFYFRNGGAEELYLASSDWMERNLDRRIELMFPIMDKSVLKATKEMLMLYFQDNTHAHILSKNGNWKVKEPEKKEQSVRVQEVLYKKYKKRNDSRKSIPHSEFEVRRKG